LSAAKKSAAKKSAAKKSAAKKAQLKKAGCLHLKIANLFKLSAAKWTLLGCAQFNLFSLSYLGDPKG
jgi:hypothetical protein